MKFLTSSATISTGIKLCYAPSDRGVEGKGWRDMNLNNDQGVMVNCRAPLKVVERTNKERGSSETGV